MAEPKDGSSDGVFDFEGLGESSKISSGSEAKGYDGSNKTSGESIDDVTKESLWNVKKIGGNEASRLMIESYLRLLDF